MKACLLPSPTHGFVSTRKEGKIRKERNVLASAKKKTYASFEDLLERSNVPVLVDFYATWCGPCQMMVPVLSNVQQELLGSVQVIKIDTEKYPKIASKYGIQALPTLVLFRDGRPVERIEGLVDAKQLKERILRFV